MNGSEPSDRMRERVPADSRWFWFVLTADRRTVTGILLGLLFASIVAVGVLHPTPAAVLLARGGSTGTLFNALVAATITTVTLVLTISQLVLGQELGAVGDQQERMADALAFREDVSAVVDEAVPPPEPAALLRELVASTSESASRLDSATADADLPPDALDAIESLVGSVTANAEPVMEQLEGARFGSFEVVWAALNYNYSWKLHEADRIRACWGERLGVEADDALADLEDALVLFGSAREHVKTLYFQWELSDLSRTLVLTAIPALAAAVVGVLFVDPADLGGSTLGVNHALLVVVVLATTSVTPFAVLLAYVLRIVTVTKRTLAIGPLILRETDRE